MKRFMKFKKKVYEEIRRSRYSIPEFKGQYTDIYICVDDIEAFEDGIIYTTDNTFEDLDITAKDMKERLEALNHEESC